MLFHYTTFEGIQGIIKSEELHATSIHYLNDYKEFQDALEKMSSAIYLKRQSANPEQIKLLDALKGCAESIERVNIHVVSFTAKGDLLSQWRGYCPSGGVAIGFDYEKLKNLAQSNNFWLRKCIYRDSEKKAIVTKLLDFVMDVFERKLVDVKEAENIFCENMVLIAPCFKDRAFEEEEEWRLVSWLTPSNDQRVDVKIKNHKLFPYFKFSLKGLPPIKDKKDIGISRYVLSPSNDKKLIGDAFFHLLMLNNIYHEQGHFSEVPYRSF